MISVFKRSQKRKKRYQKEGRNYQNVLVEVFTQAIQKKLHVPHKQNHKRRKTLEKITILILLLWFQMISNVIL